MTVDHHRLTPAITTFNGRSGQTVGTPAIDSNLERDVYVTFDAIGGTGSTSGAQIQSGLPAGSVAARASPSSRCCRGCGSGDW